MYSTTDFCKGLKIEIDGAPFEIIEFQHFKPGKGGVTVHTKPRNILNGRVLDNTFRFGEKVERLNLESRDMQFLYYEGKQLAFMGVTAYDQMYMDTETTDGKASYLRDGQECHMLLYSERSLDIEIPTSLVLEVTGTEPSTEDDTMGNVTKPATLETGVVIQVPIFVNIGDRVKIDTRTNDYLGRE